MRTIDDYMDAAIEKQGFRSASALARALGKTVAVASQWRTKRSWPSDQTMVDLADLAGIDRSEALLDLAAWRTAGEASVIWQDVARRLKSAAAAAFVIAVLGFSGPAGAGTLMEHGNIPAQGSVYYGKLYRRFMFQGLKRIFGSWMPKNPIKSMAAYHHNHCAISVIRDSIRRNVDGSTLHIPAPHLCHG